MKVHSFLVLSAAATLITYTASATPLTEWDLFAAGDALITVDKTTGLEWLDINATAGLSYDQVRASKYYTDLGFTHASIEQIRTLLADAGVSHFSAIFSSREELLADPRVRDVLEYFRTTSTTIDQPIEASSAFKVIAAQLAQTGESASPPEVDLHFYGTIRAEVQGGLIGDPWQFEMEITKRLPDMSGTAAFGATEPWDGGHYLVRAAVPELMPTAWLILAVFPFILGKHLLSGGTRQP